MPATCTWSWDRPPQAHGVDVDGDGNGVLTAQRLHQLIRQPLPVADRRFEIEFDDPGVLVTVFTFGRVRQQGVDWVGKSFRRPGWMTAS
jgi:hypothetical protein